MPRRKTDGDYQRHFNELDRKAAQIEARREQLEARQRTEHRKRMTRGKRVLGDALLRHCAAADDADVIIAKVIDQYVTAARDREVVAWVLVQAGGGPVTAVASQIDHNSLEMVQDICGAIRHGLKASAFASPPRDAALHLEWRRGQEQARIILGGALLRRHSRDPAAPFSLAQLLADDVVRGGDRLALMQAFRGHAESLDRQFPGNQ